MDRRRSEAIRGELPDRDQGTSRARPHALYGRSTIRRGQARPSARQRRLLTFTTQKDRYASTAPDLAEAPRHPRRHADRRDDLPRDCLRRTLHGGGVRELVPRPMRPGRAQGLFGAWAQEGGRDHRGRKRRDRQATHGDFRMGEPEAGGALFENGEPKKARKRRHALA